MLGACHICLNIKEQANLMNLYPQATIQHGGKHT